MKSSAPRERPRAAGRIRAGFGLWVCLGGLHLSAAEPAPGPAGLTNWVQGFLRPGSEAGDRNARPRTGHVLVFKEGRVKVLTRLTGKEEDAREGQALGSRDQVRTPVLGRALVLEFAETAGVDQRSVVEVGDDQRLYLRAGRMYVKSLGKDAGTRLWVTTPSGQAVAEGTEFQLEVDPDTGETELWVGGGAVTLTNAHGMVTVTAPPTDGRGPGASWGVMPSGDSPRTETSVVESFNQIIQWLLYYPAVLDLDEFPNDLGADPALASAVAAYRQGDLVTARERYDFSRPVASDGEALLRAALLVAGGQIGEAEEVLRALEATGPADRVRRLAGSLRELVAAVKSMPGNRTGALTLASEYLAESYRLQAATALPDNLGEALAAARKSTELSPAFGFAWARVAELEFSHGRARQAEAAIEQARRLTPDNPQVRVLEGYILSAQGRRGAALAAFEEAVLRDGRLGDAWLGLGLCLIRQGDREAGLRCLQMAVAREPQRAILKSYLGKAYEAVGQPGRALEELATAARTDPADPTPWLYSALLKWDANRVNEAIAHLERSKELNDNRVLLRSRALLDQDRAVRGANLAAIYQAAGLAEISVEEATAAVSTDYANYAAHLFLANSYNALRDPNQVNLRYETVTFAEHLLAVLLSPVGGARLSPQVSAQEYSRFFDRTGVGLASDTAYLSRGVVQQTASQFGVFGSTEYSVDVGYGSREGYAPNTDLEAFTVGAQIKQEFGPQDAAYVQVAYARNEGGDVRQMYDPADASPDLRFEETQAPNLFAGYRHTWQPGVVTLALFGRLDDTLELSAPTANVPLFARENGQVVDSDPQVAFDERWRSGFTAYSGELQQLWRAGAHTFVGGGRYQAGEIETRARLADPEEREDLFADPPEYDWDQRNDLERAGVYVYDTVELSRAWQVTAGLAYDWVSYPRNSDYPPLAPGQEEASQVSPKAGVVWTPGRGLQVRGAYTRSLGGVYYDNSIRLEPTHVAGFNQAYRSLIPESLEGNIPGTSFETAGVSVTQQLRSRTYLGIGGAWLRSESERDLGAFALEDYHVPAATTTIRQTLDYDEQSLGVHASQLVGEEWSFGARYRFTVSHLEQVTPSVAAEYWPGANGDEQAWLHQVGLFTLFNHRCGAFASLEALWLAQETDSDTAALPDEEFWQFNAYVGYRFPRRVATLTLGVLNLTDTDYRLNPLSAYPDLARERTLLLSLRFVL